LFPGVLVEKLALSARSEYKDAMSIETVEWYHEALADSEGQVLWAYMLACEEDLLDWREQLKSDFKEGYSDLVTDEDFDILQTVWTRIGPRMFFDSPQFEIGDGAHILFSNMDRIPVTVVRVLDKAVYVCLDQVWYRDIPKGRTALYTPKLNPSYEQLRVFTRRADGTYRLLGSRKKNSMSLRLGRSFERSPRGRVAP
jgi:hypothetical protein